MRRICTVHFKGCHLSDGFKLTKNSRLLLALVGFGGKQWSHRVKKSAFIDVTADLEFVCNLLWVEKAAEEVTHILRMFMKEDNSSIETRSLNNR